MKYAIGGWFALWCYLVACEPPPPPVDPSGPVPTCADVCKHWDGLGCIEATPSPAGVTCAEVCEGSIAERDFRCLAAVESCEAIQTCD